MIFQYHHNGYQERVTKSLSRMNDCDDWGIQTWVFMLLDKEWGPHSFDRFATNYNRKCDSFNSKFWCSGTSGIYTFRFSWSSDNNWLVPPPCLVIDTKQVDKRERYVYISSSGMEIGSILANYTYWF